MVVFGGLLAVMGLLTLIFRDGDIIGVSPGSIGVVLLVLGAAVAGLGVVRRVVGRRRRAARGEPEPVGNVFERAQALPRLVRAARSGAYPGLPTSRLALWGFALLYLISPIDILPDLLPIIGVADDAGVAVWLSAVCPQRQACTSVTNATVRSPSRAADGRSPTVNRPQGS